MLWFILMNVGNKIYEGDLRRRRCCNKLLDASSSSFMQTSCRDTPQNFLICEGSREFVCFVLRRTLCLCSIFPQCSRKFNRFLHGKRKSDQNERLNDVRLLGQMPRIQRLFRSPEHRTVHYYPKCTKFVARDFAFFVVLSQNSKKPLNQEFV